MRLPDPPAEAAHDRRDELATGVGKTVFEFEGRYADTGRKTFVGGPLEATGDPREVRETNLRGGGLVTFMLVGVAALAVGGLYYWMQHRPTASAATTEAPGADPSPQPTPTDATAKAAAAPAGSAGDGTPSGGTGSAPAAAKPPTEAAPPKAPETPPTEGATESSGPKAPSKPAHKKPAHKKPVPKKTSSTKKKTGTKKPARKAKVIKPSAPPKDDGLGNLPKPP
ncbi:MAG: hypothetical protein D6705_11410 [Deltaproteobacteria bacterium]|nr:MAG: hypothetical protein D6705_11410 [Deltaproteobacteria bacterium]